MKAAHRAGRRRWMGRAAAVLALAMVPSLLGPTEFQAEAKDKGLGRPKLPAPREADLRPLKAKPDKKSAAALKKAEAADKAAARRARDEQAAKPVWPTPGSVTMDVPATGTARAKAGSLPVTIAAPKKKHAKAADEVTVTVLDRKKAKAAGVDGVMLTVTGNATGAARLAVDYRKFAVGGADFAGRLRLVQLPACALTKPHKRACRIQKELPSTNNRRTARVTGDITVPKPATTPTPDRPAAEQTTQPRQMALLAVTAGASSGLGNYKATPLAASSAWQAGGSSGSFSWSHPLTIPAPAAGPEPDLAISYDSSSVDGRTANTNNQSSMVGEGFDITSSYVERKYHSCDDDGETGKYDLCWKYTNASLVLNGKASELVKDDTSGEWRLKNDDASKVELLLDTTLGNGDGNGEHWRITTGEGTKYTFGLHKLPGAPSGERTNSVWTVPVFGDDQGEPGWGNSTTFGGRAVTQAWRWNLDMVEDTRGNAMTYWYAQEKNFYAKNGVDTPGTEYVRGGYLKEIRYGQRADALFTGTPAASNKVTFNVAERCLAASPGCNTLDEAHRTNWPDVPYDAICKTGDACTGQTSPTFFTRNRLTSVDTYFWNTKLTTPAFDQVDSYRLKHLYLDPGEVGDSSDQSLWLDELQRVGTYGTDIELPALKFGHEMFTNRVDGKADNILPLGKPRLATIVSETGQQTTINYMPAECTAAMTKPAEDNNTKRCYPIYWSPNGGSVPQLDWFQKYPVSDVRLTSVYGGTLAVNHHYDYSGGGAWHYNDDPMTPQKERTWSIWRGYGKVTHTVGDDTGPKSKDVTVYLRGMHADKQKDGSTRTVEVSGIKAAPIDDLDQYAGFTREQVTYDGADEISGKINDPWSKKTATQHKSYADTESYYVRTEASHARTRVTSGITATDKTRTTQTTYDDYGMPVTVEDSATEASGDEVCTRTWYARNATAGLTALVSRQQVVAKKCTVATSQLDLPANDARPGDVIGDTATSYDTTTWSADQVPTKGEVRWIGRVNGYDASDNPIWQKVTETTYDTLGRATLVTNNVGSRTRTTYVPSTAGPLTQMDVYNDKDHKTVTVMDASRGLPLKTTDPNNRITEQSYDSLGRLTEVWLANRSHVLGQGGNYKFGYSISNTEPSWLSTSVLGKTQYNTSYEIYDALQRPRQTQAPSPRGGRIVNETLYDDRGLAVESNADLWESATAPSGELVATAGGSAPLHTDTSYDATGRPTQVVTKTYSTTRWTTTTSYTGDSATTTAPAGGKAVTLLSNLLGQVTESREYPNPTPTGTPAITAFTYAPGGQTKTVTGPDTKQWSYGYDLKGRRTTATDPDSGTTKSTYTSLDLLDNTTDAEDRKLLYGYDSLGRKTGLWQTDKTDANKLAAWTYDTVANGKGYLDSATRYVGGTTGKAYAQKVTAYNSLYQPLSTQLQLPAAADEPLVAAGVPQTLDFATAYNVDGTIQYTREPAVAGLPATGTQTYEQIDYTYNTLGMLNTAKGVTGYLLGTTYTTMGLLEQQTLGSDSAGKKVYVANQYEDGTRRLKESDVTTDTHSYMLQDLKYTHDDAGNITAISDTATWQGTSQADHQCFAYDGHRRLTEAWTPKTADCSTTGRTTSNLGGAAPYWFSYTYNSAGQRKTQTQHGASGDTAVTYTYGTDTGQPHPLTKTETTVPGSSTPTTETYKYDKAGNTTSRPGTQATQTLSWNSEGKLAQASEPAAETKPATSTQYLYGPDGQLLIRRAATTDGETVLYLGSTEVKLTVSNSGANKALSGTRYYAGGAVRTADAGTTSLSFQAGDHHGTMSLTVKDNTAQPATRRYLTPFGAPRGNEPSTWPDDKAFLGKPADDTTGLTHIGAREYDPTLGQFLSVDPLLETDKPQTLNGYSYGAQNPVTHSDPTGLGLACGRDTGSPEECGTGVVTHGDGSLSKDGNPTGGGVAPGYAGTNQSSGTNGGNNKGSTKQPELVPGVEIPTEEYLRNIGYDPFGNQTYSQLLVRWAENLCYQNSGSPECNAAHQLGWIRPSGDFLELIGVRDAIRCAQGSVSGCVWTVAGLLPVGKLAKAANLIKKGDTEAARALACLRPSSFLPGTQVLMADGSTKEIEDLRIGDQVLATDPWTGETSPQKVTAELLSEGFKNLVKITVQEETDDKQTLTATENHPFWVVNAGQWVDAGDLKLGQWLRTSAGTLVQVKAIQRWTQSARVHNLTIAGLHTYYVLAGSHPVLVHNAGSVGACPESGIDHGALGAFATADRLAAEGYQNITKEVRFLDSNGDVFIADFIARRPDGAWVAVEVKTNTGPLTPNQSTGYPELTTTGAVLQSSKLKQYGFKKGDKVRMETVEIDHWLCPDC
ncbi:RHS repeat-associated core domain-containing protein [Streptomyces cyaneochromogenes]|uniref:RHS repeat-associated core domain-containing protein n=1 Tax=Streptomyces cyaneochromogenes TaxID=2496836 RepID=A0A3Q9EN72_9ACTN|nr:polymorphic toxin-type HINT domain-containing protein [Streptomyces cyaneochromogenes]AZQ32129.1 RHS repeat-associated core domain-containing protein [Streptomyces cyaneochromogenes]AZQ40094.1 RHS repeat-associated core domain-containing protein [Streptomyces cyaneochromogenes]